jgi:hypothetical protein
MEVEIPWALFRRLGGLSLNLVRTAAGSMLPELALEV